MTRQEMVLNIRYDAPEEVWDKLSLIYGLLTGWLGFGQGGEFGQSGIPYWFSYNENEKHITASVEPGGLQFTALIEQEEWQDWVKKIKMIATEQLGYTVGEIQSGEVDF